MMQADHPVLSNINGAWIHLLTETASKAHELSWRLNNTGFVARVLRGAKMRELQGLFDEVAAVLQFPDYFGENWPALHECLSDLEWLKGEAYVLIVTDAAKFLDTERGPALETFFKTADMARKAWANANGPGSTWSHGPVPFHIVLQEDIEGVTVVAHRLQAVGVTFSELAP